MSGWRAETDRERDRAGVAIGSGIGEDEERGCVREGGRGPGRGRGIQRDMRQRKRDTQRVGPGRETRETEEERRGLCFDHPLDASSSSIIITVIVVYYDRLCRVSTRINAEGRVCVVACTA